MSRSLEVSEGKAASLPQASSSPTEYVGAFIGALFETLDELD
jgi:hypothetical protein